MIIFFDKQFTGYFLIIYFFSPLKCQKKKKKNHHHIFPWNCFVQQLVFVGTVKEKGNS